MSVPSTESGTWWLPSLYLVAFCLHTFIVQSLVHNDHLIFVGSCLEAQSQKVLPRTLVSDGLPQCCSLIFCLESRVNYGSLAEHHSAGRCMV